MATRDQVLANLNMSLFGIVRQYDSFRTAFAREQKVSVTELRAMSRIVENPTITPKQLAASLELTTGAVTALVDRLVEDGLVLRAPHPTDRRSLLLAPTDSGIAVMQLLIDDFEEMLRHGTVEIDDARLGLLGELLGALVQNAPAILAD